MKHSADKVGDRTGDVAAARYYGYSPKPVEFLRNFFLNCFIYQRRALGEELDAIHREKLIDSWGKELVALTEDCTQLLVGHPIFLTKKYSQQLIGNC
jgi:hypothetical protein